MKKEIKNILNSIAEIKQSLYIGEKNIIQKIKSKEELILHQLDHQFSELIYKIDSFNEKTENKKDISFELKKKTEGNVTKYFYEDFFFVFHNVFGVLDLNLGNEIENKKFFEILKKFQNERQFKIIHEKMIEVIKLKLFIC